MYVGFINENEGKGIKCEVLPSILLAYAMSLINSIIQAAQMLDEGAQWLSGRVLESRRRGRGFQPHRHHCVARHIKPSVVWFNPGRPVLT